MTAHVAEQQLINPSGIARLAGVAPSTVSNWRIRDKSFPEPVNENAARPLFSVAKVTAWLKSKNIEIVNRPQALVLADTIRGAVPVEKFVEVLLPLLCAEHWARRSGTSLIHTVTNSSRKAASQGGTFDVSPGITAAARELTRSSPLISSAIRRSLEVVGQAWGDTPKLEHVCAVIADISDLSQAAEDIIEATARNAKSPLNVHSAPRAFARFLDGILPPGGKSFADLACGFGRTLLTVSETRPGARLVGNDVNKPALEAAACQLFLRDLSADLDIADILQSEDGSSYDRVVLHPPFGLRVSETHALRPWLFGAPPKGQADLLWPQAAFEQLTEEGYAAVVLPTAALTRGGKAREVWARMIARGAIEAVISLPGNSQLNTALPVSVLVLRAHSESRGVLMMRLPDTRAFSNKHTSITEEQQWEAYASAIQILSSWRDGGSGTTDMSVEVPTEKLLAPDGLLTPQSWLAALSPLSKDRADQVAKAVQEDMAALEKTIRAWEAPPSPQGLSPQVDAVPLRPVSELMLCIPRGSYTKPKDSDAADSATTHKVYTLSSLRSGEPEVFPVQTTRSTKPVIAERGDVLVANVGRRIITLVCRDEGGAEVDRNLGVVRPPKNAWDADFVAQQLMADHNQAMLSGATVQRVDIRQLLVPTLPIDEQRAASELVRQFTRFAEEAKAAAERAEQYMSAVRNALASGSFTISAAPDVRRAQGTTQEQARVASTE